MSVTSYISRRIGIIGKAGSGKSASSSYLVRQYGFTRIGLADKLKEICKELWPEEFLNGNKPRKLLQTIGTEVFRGYDEEVWVKYVLRQIQDMETEIGVPLLWVVDDIRFKNEVTLLKENGFFFIRIKGPQRIEMPLGTTAHQSEIELESIVAGYEIENTTSVEALYKKIDEILLQKALNIQPWCGALG